MKTWERVEDAVRFLNKLADHCDDVELAEAIRDQAASLEVVLADEAARLG